MVTVSMTVTNWLGASGIFTSRTLPVLPPAMPAGSGQAPVGFKYSAMGG